MSEKKLFKTFVQDSRNFIDAILQLLSNLEKDPGNSELILHAYRNAHSLKSEAAFLREEEVVKISHAMENIFEKYKKPGTFITKPDIDKLVFSIDRINEILDYYTGTTHSGSESPDEVLTEETEKGKTDILSFPSLTAFEKSLLREAKERGETFYRLIFEIDSDCPMKYAKAFLVISNLESLVNVIRTVPAFGDEDESLYRRMCIYFTASVPEKEIHRAVTIDQITSIKLAHLSYDLMLKNSSLDIVRRHKRSILKVDSDSLDEIANYIDEIKIDIHRLMKVMEKNDAQKMIMKYAERIKAYSIGLEGAVKEIEMVSIEESLYFFTRYVRELGLKLGKRVILSIEGGDIKVSRNAGEILSEILSHLVRNAVDHGIETEIERTAAGKNPSGSIRIKAEQLDDSLRISVEDDGRGINRDEISSKLTNGAVDLTKDENLLKILLQSGNTTKEEVNSLSGRGIGLDIVAQKIKQLPGGELLLESTLHEGTRFTIVIPGGFTLTTFQLIRSGSLILAVPVKNIHKIVDVTMEKYRPGDDGSLLLGNVPVFTLDGKVLATDRKPAETKGVSLHYLGNEGIFLFDEILFEKSLSEQNLTLVIDDNQYLYKVLYGGTPAEYLYLNPALVVG